MRVTTHPTGGIKYYDDDDHFHRDDGPAIASLDGVTFAAWYRHGRKHRLGGPALRCLNPNGTFYTECWVNGVRVSEFTASYLRFIDVTEETI